MVDYWHGGPQGILVGELLTSPAERRNKLSSPQVSREIGYAAWAVGDSRDRKRVYFTTDRELARAWAVRGYDEGSLYRVRPVPPASLETDPDFPECGFSARRAEVLEVAELRVEMAEDDACRRCSRYQTWSDLSPMYDDEGYLLPPPEHRTYGKTAIEYRKFGKWFPVLTPVELDPETGELWTDQPAWTYKAERD